MKTSARAISYRTKIARVPAECASRLYRCVAMLLTALLYTPANLNSRIRLETARICLSLNFLICPRSAGYAMENVMKLRKTSGIIVLLAGLAMGLPAQAEGVVNVYNWSDYIGDDVIGCQGGPTDLEILGKERVRIAHGRDLT